MWLLFFVVVVVIALLMVFLIVAIRVLADQAKKQLNSYFLKNLKTYDRLAEHKSAEVEKIEEEIKALVKEKQSVQERITQMKRQSGEQSARTMSGGSSEVNTIAIPPAALRDKSFLEDYAYIRQNMRQNLKEVVDKILTELDFSEDAETAMCKSILSKLPDDKIYDIIILSDEKQIEYLKELFTDEEDKYLLDYVEQHAAGFDLLSFRTQVKNYLATHENVVYLRTGTPEELKELASDRVKILYDSGVHEGVRISFKDRIYDFSI